MHWPITTKVPKSLTLENNEKIKLPVANCLPTKMTGGFNPKNSKGVLFFSKKILVVLDTFCPRL